MSPWFERGRVHIPYADVYSRKLMEPLIDELVEYPGRTTDTVMAFWFAFRALEEAKPPYLSTSYVKKPLVFGPRGRRVIQNPYYAR